MAADLVAVEDSAAGRAGVGMEAGVPGRVDSRPQRDPRRRNVQHRPELLLPVAPLPPVELLQQREPARQVQAPGPHNCQVPQFAIPAQGPMVDRGNRDAVADPIPQKVAVRSSIAGLRLEGPAQVGSAAVAMSAACRLPHRVGRQSITSVAAEQPPGRAETQSADGAGSQTLMVRQARGRASRDPVLQQARMVPTDTDQVPQWGQTEPQSAALRSR